MAIMSEIKDHIAVCLLALSVSLQLVTCELLFFHKESAVILESDVPNNMSLFGLSMGYWNNQLIVGAPRSNYFGEVQSCDVKKPTKNIVKCHTVDINVTSNDIIPQDIMNTEHFYLGATISTTDKYFFTCAPLLSRVLKKTDQNVRDAVGACYYYCDDKTNPYMGPYERSIENSIIYSDISLYVGGVGWNTFADDKKLIVAKTSESTDINYSSSSMDFSGSTFPESLMNNGMKLEQNVGYGITAGNFFADNFVYYAVSQQSNYMKGEIIFLRQKNMQRMKQRSTEYKIRNKYVGANFGYSLAAADLNSDLSDELIVGAPTNSEDIDETECGAVYIFYGGAINDCNQACLIGRRRTIFADKERGRFGTAVAAQDIDLDGHPEIIVSAPYEDEGVVYIISGIYLNSNKFLSPDPYRLSTFKDYMQRVSRSGIANLGFSIHVMPDLNKNGCDELALGAPDSAKVLLLKCFQAVNAKISLKLVGNQDVRENDTTCVMNVNIDIDRGTNLANYSGSLIVTNEITAGRATISPTDKSYTLDLSDINITQSSKNITVTFDDNVKGKYQFKTTVRPNNAKLQSEDFDESWVMLRPDIEDHGNEVTHIIHRRPADGCSPTLEITNTWTGPNNAYELGSSKSENLTVVVTNIGCDANDACVRVEITGAHVTHRDAAFDGSGYKFDLISPLQKDNADTINLELNMQNLTNKDKKLIVRTMLYDKCNLDEYDKEFFLNVSYLNTQKDQVTVKGLKNDFEITDDQIQDKNVMSFQVVQEFAISNKGSITWEDIQAVIYLENQTFIDVVNNPDNCVLGKEDDAIKMNCTLSIRPGQTRIVLASANLSKVTIGESFNGGHSKYLTSRLFLYLDPNEDYTFNETLVTEIKLKTDRTLGNNASLIIIISVIVSTVVLAIIAFVLYKYNFFKRKERKRLDVLRESVRRRSIRLASESKHSQKTASCADGDHIDIEVVDDSPFEEIPIGTNDNVILVEARAQVHHDPTNENGKNL